MQRKEVHNKTNTLLLQQQTKTTEKRQNAMCSPCSAQKTQAQTKFFTDSPKATDREGVKTGLYSLSNYFTLSERLFLFFLLATLSAALTQIAIYNVSPSLQFN